MAFEVQAGALSGCFPGMDETMVPEGVGLYRGKVRDVFDLGDRLVITATDRISAFDRVLSTIPYKGEILNRVSLHWFKLTKHIIPNHILEVLSPRSVVVKKAKVVPVEVVVRGYLTGSAWRDYTEGKPVSGIALPAGMKRDQAFSEPLITPSTKEDAGKHDEPVSEAEIVRRGIVEEPLWRKIRETAISLFRIGTQVALGRGLILVDTKYEFGVLGDGKLILVDEIHTPDSSRYWYASGYETLFRAGGDQRQLDKEFFRRWLLDRGFKGEGEPPAIPDQVRLDVAKRYAESYEAVTGEEFVPQAGDFEAERKILESYWAGRR